MKTRGKVLLVGGVLALTAAVMRPARVRMDAALQPEARFGTRAEAVAAAPGWVPAFLPQSATDLHELHDLDSAESWATFQASAPDLAALRARLAEARVALPAAPFASWPLHEGDRPEALGTVQEGERRYAVALLDARHAAYWSLRK